MKTSTGLKEICPKKRQWNITIGNIPYTVIYDEGKYEFDEYECSHTKTIILKNTTEANDWFAERPIHQTSSFPFNSNFIKNRYNQHWEFYKDVYNNKGEVSTTIVLATSHNEQKFVYRTTDSTVKEFIYNIDKKALPIIEFLLTELEENYMLNALKEHIKDKKTVEGKYIYGDNEYHNFLKRNLT